MSNANYLQLPKFRQVVEDSKYRNRDDVATNVRGPGKLRNYMGFNNQGFISNIFVFMTDLNRMQILTKASMHQWAQNMGSQRIERAILQCHISI